MADVMGRTLNAKNLMAVLEPRLRAGSPEMVNLVGIIVGAWDKVRNVAADEQDEAVSQVMTRLRSKKLPQYAQYEADLVVISRILNAWDVAQGGSGETQGA